jgi:hypothetical protein
MRPAAVRTMLNTAAKMIATVNPAISAGTIVRTVVESAI